MPTTLDALALRRRLGRARWGVPSPFGPDGWTLSGLRQDERVIVTVSEEKIGGEQVEWLHASISHATMTPPYSDLRLLHAAVWEDGYAYQQFVPSSHHVNIHPNALHLWGRADGLPILPVYQGSI